MTDGDVALARLSGEIIELRKQVMGAPDERREGLWDRVVAMEKAYSRLREAIEREADERKAEQQSLRDTFREQEVKILMYEVRVKWLFVGLSGFGALSALLIGLVFRLLGQG